MRERRAPVLGGRRAEARPCAQRGGLHRGLPHRLLAGLLHCLFSGLLGGLLIGALLGGAACGLGDVAPGADSVVTCEDDGDCPPSFGCNARVGRCVDDRDQTPPDLTDVVVDRSAAGPGVVVTVEFGVSEALFALPVVRLGDVGEFARDAQASTAERHRYTYVAGADDAVGAHPVTVDLLDPFGNARSAVAGTLTLDFTPPAVAAAVIDDPLLASGEQAVVNVTTTEPLAVAPTAVLVRTDGFEAPLALPLQAGEPGGTTFSFACDGSERASAEYRLRLTLLDAAGNTALAEPGIVVAFDAAPPAVLRVDGPAIEDPAGLVVVAARSGARVTLALTLSPDVLEPPVVDAGDVALRFVARGDAGFVYELLVDESTPEGELPLAVAARDSAGHVVVLRDDPATSPRLPSIRVDKSPPAPPATVEEGAVVLRRLRGDGSVAAPRGLAVVFAPGAVEPGARVFALSRALLPAEVDDDAFRRALDATTLGSGVADDEGALVITRDVLDAERVYVIAVDDAGHRSASRLVRDVEWMGTPDGSDDGPQLLAAPRFDGSLATGPGVTASGPELGATTVVGAGAWALVPRTATPTARAHLAAAYDAARGVVVAYGGLASEGGCEGTDGTYCGETWEWDGSSFRPVVPLDPESDGDPTPRFGHAMAYDPLRARVVLFGGKDTSGACDDGNSVFCGGTWAWSGASWRRLIDDPQGTPPTPRLLPAMAYDLGRDRLVVFGGISDGSCAGTVLGCRDTFEFDGTRWSRVTSEAFPSARSAAAMAYDEARGVIVLFGGLRDDLARTPSDETWEFDGRWQRVAVDGGARPPARFGHGMAFDPDRARVVLFGGRVSTRITGSCGGTGVVLCDDAWEFDGAGWTRLVDDERPPARADAALVHADVAGGLTTLLGRDGAGDLDDVWTRSDAGWRRRAPADPDRDGDPRPRSAPGLARDPRSGAVVVAGGVCATGPCADQWRFDDTGWLDAAVSAPAGVVGALVPLGDDLLRLGDLTAAADTTEAGVLRFDGATWAPLVAAGDDAGPRRRYAAAHDPVRDVVVVFGGLVDDAGATPCPDDGGRHPEGACASRATLELAADGTWRVTAVDGVVPPARLDAALAYDEQTGAMVLFGGKRCGAQAVQGANCDGVDEFTALDDTWLYQEGGWTASTTTGPRPRARAEHALAFDPGRQRVVLFGGAAAANTNCGTGSRFCRDLWEWTGDGWQSQTPAPGPDGSPRPRAAAGLIADERGGGVLLFGGTNDPGETWRWQGGADARPAWRLRLALGAAGVGAAARVDRLEVLVTAAGRSADGDGARLLVWSDGRFGDVDAHDAGLDAGPAALVWSTDDPAVLARVLGARDARVLDAAIVPRGDSGTGERAALRATSVKVQLRYRLDDDG